MNRFKGINKDSLEKVKPFLLIALHIIGLVLVFHFLSFWDFFRGFATTKQWDANWYERIATSGYEFKANEASSCGFFPLFAYVWRFVPFDNRGIVFVNFVLYIIGLLLLKRTFSFSNSFLLLGLSIPSVMFMYVPYTEALFFFSTSVFMYGLIKNNLKALYIGLFIASLTRPTAVFFIPAIVFMELMRHEDVKTTILNIVKYSSASLLGILIVVVIQYFQTGVWFAYFKAQSNAWDREFQMPALPFTTWDGTRLLWIDGIALFFGLFSLGIVLYLLCKKWILKKTITTDKVTLFSFAYLVMAVFSVIFFNPKDAYGGTSLMGANRYILATPCFVILLNYISKDLVTDKFLGVIAFAICIICAFMLGGGTDIRPYDQGQSNRYVLFVSIYLLSHLLLGTRYQKQYIFVLYFVNIFVQVILISHFSTGLWVG